MRHLSHNVIVEEFYFKKISLKIYTGNRISFINKFFLKIISYYYRLFDVC